MSQDYETLEQFAAWLFEHEASLTIRSGVIDGTTEAVIEMNAPAKASVVEAVSRKEMDLSKADIRTEVIRRAWRKADQGMGH